MSLRISCATSTQLAIGDRFEVAIDETTDAPRLMREDWTGGAITIDPGDLTSLVFRVVGPKSAPVRARYLENQLKPLDLVYQRSRRFS